MNCNKKAIRSILTILYICIFAVKGFGLQNNSEPKPALIPYPQKIEWGDENFLLNQPFTIHSSYQECDQFTVHLNQELKKYNSIFHKKNETYAHSERKLIIKIIPELPDFVFNKEEAYQLIVRKDSVVLQAKTHKGLYNGIQTLKQLVSNNGEPHLHACEITDWPAFKVRGFMIDVGRNFIPLPVLKEILDVMAAYKLNVFHLHLTDNPGWRLESQIYPELTNPESMSRWPGMFYAQDDFLELLEYCRVRNITLIPELDIPGHCEAFRKAFDIDSMSDSRVQPILFDLIDELCILAPAEQMPFIHLGTDEVRHSHERSAPDLIQNLFKKLEAHNREIIVWRPGQVVADDSSTITQLWSSHGNPRPGHRYLDSRLNYLNHLDPLAGIPQLYFDRICGAARGDSLRLGGILCCWNDNNVSDAYDILRYNPVYPGMLTYSETSWKGQSVSTGADYLAKLPSQKDALFQEFCEFEERLIKHRNLYFKEKPFQYVKQTNIQWNIIGPFDNHGKVNKRFVVEDSLVSQYVVDSMEYSWRGPFTGGTIHINHFFNYPSYFPTKEGTHYAFTQIWSPKEQVIQAWIGFHDWSRSGGRRGGPFPDQGMWHNTNPKIWINGKVLDPPEWNNPGIQPNSDDLPFTDENYFNRNPERIAFRKGWNDVLIKIPAAESTWKLMYTFIPIQIENGAVREVEGLKYSATLAL